MSEFRLPSLGADMESAKLVEWMVKPGDDVSKGDIVAAVETDKGIIDIEIHASGTIDGIWVQPDEKVLVGTVLATFHEPGEPPAPPPTQPQPTAPTSAPEAAATPAQSVSAQVPETDRIRISPAARRRARELGVDPAGVHGTGIHGSISIEDIDAAAAGAAKPEEGDGMRRAIAAAMAKSKREIPHYYLGSTIDLQRTMDWLGERNSERSITDRLVYSVVLIKAVATALAKVPQLNGLYRDAGFEPVAECNIAMAISLRRGGLVVPVLSDVGGKDIDTLMSEFREMVTRARAGRLKSSDLADATITITSLGEQGVETVYPVIYPPQVAIVGFGAPIERPWVVDGDVVPRQVVYATIAADHRVSDGHTGAAFLAALERLLQQPEQL